MLGEETVRTDDPEPPGDNEIVDWLRDETGPDGEVVAVRDTLPDSPLTLVKIMLELEEVPGGVETELGVAKIVKSTTLTVTWTICEREPLVAVTVTV